MTYVPDPRHGDQQYDLSSKDVSLIAHETGFSLNYVKSIVRNRTAYNPDVVEYALGLMRLRQQFAAYKAKRAEEAAAQKAAKTQPTAAQPAL